MAIYLPTNAWLVILIASFISCCLQAFHLFTTLFVSNSVRLKKIGLVEAAVFGTLLLNMELCCFAAKSPLNTLADIIAVAPLELGVLRLMFLLLFCELVGLVLSKNLLVLADMAVAALLLPGVMNALGGWWIASPLFVTGYGLFRTLNDLRYDTHRMNTTVTKLSLSEALHVFPDGLLLIGAEDRVLLLNNQMRTALDEIDVSVDWDNASNLFGRLRSREHAVIISRDSVQIEGSAGKTYVFASHPIKMRGVSCLCLTAIDVSEQLSVEQELLRVNCKLQEANDNIATSMSEISDLADIQATLVMKARVHDIIGQRLSMLHRLVEDGDVSMERVNAIRPALENLVEDLSNFSAEIHDEPEILLSSVVNAFASAGLKVEASGELPNGVHLAETFVKMIRECSTNAMKHGHANTVQVELAEDEQNYHCVVKNNGTVDTNSYTEGTGLRGLRTTMEGLGGSLKVTVKPNFMVHAVVPKDNGFYGILFKE